VLKQQTGKAKDAGYMLEKLKKEEIIESKAWLIEKNAGT
jgi:hypothetical protein